MRLPWRVRVREKSCYKLDDDTVKLIRYYMDANNLGDFESAIIDLIHNGYNYWLLKRKYGEDKLESRELWDEKFRCMKIESRLLYYRLRLKEVIDEIKNAILILSGVIADLEDCHRHCKTPRVDVEKLRVYRNQLHRYINTFIKPVEEDVEDDGGVDYDTMLIEIERLVKRYKKILGRANK